MCGFAGAIQLACSEDEWHRNLSKMAHALRKRGPDDEGIWFDAVSGIGLAHRRLSILDLSPQGHQPMISASGRYVIAYNGEIYNFERIRNELDELNLHWNGHSDTEVILAACEAWGMERAVEKFIGIFAFALWDDREKELCLVRDHLGVKPLYYGINGDLFLFGSDLNSFRAHPEFQPEIDRHAVGLYLRYSYIPTPFSVYRGISKLQPGHFVKISRQLLSRREVGQIHCYWSAERVVQRGQGAQRIDSEREAQERLETLLLDAVKLQMVADVPLGAFLSGGIDSSTVVALMQAQSTRPIKTFCIGFHEGAYNEAHYARAVALHLGTEHTELYLAPEEVLATIPQMPVVFDEPFSDSSQLPTLLVSRLARQSVTVSLSGDGGDELFAGYPRYQRYSKIFVKLQSVPGKSFLAKALKSASRLIPESVLDVFAPAFEKYGGVALSSDKMKWFGELLGTRDFQEFYFSVLSHWKDPSAIIAGDCESLGHGLRAAMPFGHPDLINLMMYLDLVTYLLDDILVKVDRTSMSVGLEARVPLLDHRLVEFAWQLPLSMKACGSDSKIILRRILHKYIPAELVERPKNGFWHSDEHVDEGAAS